MSHITLKKSHFNTKDVLVLSDGAVSNGHWAIRASRLKNAAIFTTPETAGAALGLNGRAMDTTFDTIAPGGELHEWTATAFVYTHARIEARVFKSLKTGAFAGIDRRILDVVGLDDGYSRVWGSIPNTPFLDAETIADASFIALPFKIDAFPVEGGNANA